MNIILYIVAFYLGYFLLWSTINAFVWAISVVLKKNLVKGLQGLSIISNYLLGLLLFLGYLYYLIQWFRTGQILLVVFMLFIGGGILLEFMSMILTLLVSPFILVSAKISESLEVQFSHPGDDYEADILTPEGKTETTIKSNNRINKNLAFYFILSYGLYLFSNLLTKRAQYENWSITDYLWNPISELFLWALIVAIFIAIYDYVKYRKFFPYGFKDLLATAYKIISIIWTAVLGFFFIRYVIL